MDQASIVWLICAFLCASVQLIWNLDHPFSSYHYSYYLKGVGKKQNSNILANRLAVMGLLSHFLDVEVDVSVQDIIIISELSLQMLPNDERQYNN